MPGPFLIAAFIASAVATTVSTVATVEANKDEEKRQKIDRRVDSLKRVKNARRAIAARRVQEAEIQQAGETQGARTSSGVSGAVGSLRAGTAGNIGFANSVFAGDTLSSNIQSRSSRRSATLGSISNIAQGAGSVFGAWSASNVAKDQQNTLNAIYSKGSQPIS